VLELDPECPGFACCRDRSAPRMAWCSPSENHLLRQNRASGLPQTHLEVQEDFSRQPQTSAARQGAGLTSERGAGQSRKKKKQPCFVACGHRQGFDPAEVLIRLMNVSGLNPSLVDDLNPADRPAKRNRLITVIFRPVPRGALTAIKIAALHPGVEGGGHGDAGPPSRGPASRLRGQRTALPLFK